jgi:ATP-binding cassette subfamily C (CFTR/MRP) protein 1
MEKVQERLAATCSVLADMRAIKLLGLNETVLQHVTSLRETEVDASQGYRTLLMWSLFIGMSLYRASVPD